MHPVLTWIASNEWLIMAISMLMRTVKLYSRVLRSWYKHLLVCHVPTNAVVVQCVDENDDGWDVIERKQKHADGLHDARGVAASRRKHVSVTTAALLARDYYYNHHQHYYYHTLLLLLLLLPRSLLGYFISTLSTPIRPNIDQNRLNSVLDSLTTTHDTTFSLPLSSTQFMLY